MPRLIPRLAVCLCLTALTGPAAAQDGFNTVYPFNGDLMSSPPSYDATLFGNESYAERGGGQVLELTGESWLDFPPDMSQAIRTDKSFFISTAFMVPNVGVDESARFLFGNKAWGWDTPGFHVRIMNEKTEWQPEGIVYLHFNIGGGNATEISERFYQVPMDEWHTAYMYVDFENERVAFGLDGRRIEQSLREDLNGAGFDPTPFISSLTERAIRVGAPYQFEAGQPPPWVQEFNSTTDNIADLQLDDLRISSPRPAGDASVVASALDQFTSALLGQSTLDDATATGLHAQVRNNLAGAQLADFAASASSFVAAHREILSPLYNEPDWREVDFNEYPPASRAYVDFGVWLLREGLTSTNASLVEGMVFQEHERFPGPTPAVAERVPTASVEVRAEYVRDPYYLMGDMQVSGSNELSSYVYRPTGFYAPAGEIVHISVDPSLVNTGLHIRVGAQKYDHTFFRETNRFPVLKVDYRIEAATFDVINPLGGGIYVLVPQGLDMGWVDVGIEGAVRAPFYSYREGRRTSPAEWETIREYPGTLADFESDKYMFTVPSAAIRSLPAPETLFERWEQALDILQMLHGRPLERARAEAFMFDTRTSVEGSYPGGYPVTPGLWSQGPTDITDGAFSPFSMTNPPVWETRGDMSAMFHEMAHHHFGYALPYEVETYVNVPFAAILNSVFGYDLDYSLKHSTYQLFSRDDAAIDWMVTANFRNGDPIGVDPTTDFQPLELAYQSRGSAKYVDLVDIFGGWQALGSIQQTFYQEDVAAGVPVTYTSQPEVTRDHFLLNGSAELGCNLGSLFHFWGIHPSGGAAGQLSAWGPCAGAKERVKHYLSAAPRTNQDLRAFHAEKERLGEGQLKFQIYELLLPSFDSEDGQQIRTTGAQILKTYFDEDPNQKPSKPEILVREFDVLGNPSDTITFEWTQSVDPEGDSLKYTWNLYDQDSGESLISRPWVDGTSVQITKEDMALALAAYVQSGEAATLAQQVTTSDVFWVVSSDVKTSGFSAGVATDRVEDVPPVEFALEAAYPNPFNLGTAISYSIAEPVPVTIMVTDIIGRRVATLLDDPLHPAGSGVVRLQGENLTSGIYLIHMSAGMFRETRPVALVK
jgi:N-terminal domain of M60-like peptidases/Peptidase M60, enhancin and enhancin-like